MSITIYTNVSDEAIKHLHSCAQKNNIPLIDVSQGLDYSIFSQPSLIYWEGIPRKDSGEGKLLRMLHTLPQVEVVVGDSKRLIRHALRRYCPEKLEKKKPIKAISSEPSNTILLIAPENECAEFESRIKSLGFDCARTGLPVGSNKEEQMIFRQSVKDARDVFVYVPEHNGKTHERIIPILSGMLDKAIERIDLHNWQSLLNEKYGKAPEPEIIEATPLEKTPEPPSVTQDIKQRITQYRELLSTYSLFNVQRELCEPMIEKDSVEETLAISQRRWERTVLTYRRPFADFKPWPVKKPPADMENTSSWDKLQYIATEQSNLSENILSLRDDILTEIASSTAIHDELQHWPEGEQAQCYFAKLHFKKLFKACIDATDLPEEGKGNEEDQSKSKIFKNKEDKAMDEAEEALKAFMGVEDRAWKAVVASELENLEQDLILRFWNFYEEVTLHWITAEKPADFQSDHLRLFLRTAYIGEGFSGVSAENKKHLSHLLSEDDIVPTYKDGETNALYFDQFLELLAQNWIAPSYDENMELNDRGSDEWKEARRLRKIATQKRTQAIYFSKKDDLLLRYEELQKIFDGYQDQLENHPPSDKRKRRELADTTHDTKITMSRTRDHLEKIDTTLATITKEGINEGYTDAFPLEIWIKKEVANLRAKIRLMNRLKERHLPTVLAENLENFNEEKYSTPKRMKGIMAEILSHDTSCCDLHLVPHRKRQFALIASVPPLLIIAPGNGLTGFAMEPCDDSSEGRIIMPSKVVSTMDLRATYMVCLADYRWDACMFQAGADWVTSDSFVAAYARVRWDYRNKAKDTREKAWIDKEDTDKKNFRRHYALLEGSMDEGGKHLFYKSKPMYENLIKYFPLPKGVDKLRS